MPQHADKKGKLRVYFKPDNIEVEVDHGANLLQAAISGGVPIAASCGGSGTCGSCALKIISGEVESKAGGVLHPEEYEQGIRLACQSRALSDLVVEIIPRSRLEGLILSSESGEVATTGSRAEPLIVSGWRFNPFITKLYLELKPPSIEDNISDLSRVLREVKAKLNATIYPEFNIVHGMSSMLRQANWRVTVAALHYRNRYLLTRLEPGDSRADNYALAFDMGTTAVRGQVLDLNRGQVMSQGTSYNKQGRYGADVISRIAYASRGRGLEELQQAASQTLNELIARLLDESALTRSQIQVAALAGNTTMTHLLLGIDPQYIRLAPYVPTISQLPPVKADDIGLDLDSHTYIYLFPSVSSYVGGDIVAGVMGAGMHKRSGITFYIDIGTNGEMVLGNKEWMISASCSAGPTFEGAGIKNGMIATAGAIQDFYLDPSTLEPRFSTIGNMPPRGICGSGVINITASLLKAGVITPAGKFNDHMPCPRIRCGEDGYEFVIAWGEENPTNKDIVITEADISNLIRAKATIYAGYETLMHQLGLTAGDIDQIIISGTFGNKLDIESAVTIGLLPDLNRDRFAFLGNGSLLGVRLGLFCTDLITQSEEIARSITNLELSESTDFMENYMAALFLPHTDRERFASVKILQPGSDREC